jgi:hypothetical protein
MKYVLTYGLLSGLVIILTMMTGILLAGHESFFSSMLFGYLVMLVAMSFIFVGVKRYRDIERGGIVKFGMAFVLGLGIATVASVVYVVVWEAYLAYSNYAFIDEFIAAMLREKQAKGISAADLAAFTKEMDELRVNYANPLFRLPMTFLEIFPVGLIVALVSAALLRNPKLLPAQA